MKPKRERNPELAQYSDEDIFTEAGHRTVGKRKTFGAGPGRPRKAKRSKVKKTIAVKSGVA